MINFATNFCTLRTLPSLAPVLHCFTSEIPFFPVAIWNLNFDVRIWSIYHTKMQFPLRILIYVDTCYLEHSYYQNVQEICWMFAVCSYILAWCKGDVVMDFAQMVINHFDWLFYENQKMIFRFWSELVLWGIYRMYREAFKFANSLQKHFLIARFESQCSFIEIFSKLHLGPFKGSPVKIIQSSVIPN